MLQKKGWRRRAKEEIHSAIRENRFVNDDSAITCNGLCPISYNALRNVLGICILKKFERTNLRKYCLIYKENLSKYENSNEWHKLSKVPYKFRCYYSKHKNKIVMAPGPSVIAKNRTTYFIDLPEDLHVTVWFTKNRTFRYALYRRKNQIHQILLENWSRGANAEPSDWELA